MVFDIQGVKNEGDFKTVQIEGEEMTHREVQQIAKDAMDFLRQNIHAGMTLEEVRALCENKMLESGADSFWYWDVGAFVFCGDQTTLSVSGREYVTSKKIIGENDIVTVDLSPQVGDTWGDYARTIILEDGKAVSSIEKIKNAEWREGLLMEEKLHEKMKGIATENTSFDELYYQMNDFIKANGFVNLDFMGNLGHYIVRRKEDRIYIEKGNTSKLGDVEFFTFEPHISKRDSMFGYKNENIYYFENGVLKEL